MWKMSATDTNVNWTVSYLVKQQLPLGLTLQSGPYAGARCLRAGHSIGTLLTSFSMADCSVASSVMLGHQVLILVLTSMIYGFYSCQITHPIVRHVSNIVRNVEGLGLKRYLPKSRQNGVDIEFEPCPFEPTW